MFRLSFRLFRDAAMTKQGPVDPLIVIIGATGTGKSQVWYYANYRSGC